MTDTEILDYLQESYTLHRNVPSDAQIGRVAFTLGTRPGTLREVLMAAIERDQQITINEVTRRLVGTGDPDPKPDRAPPTLALVQYIRDAVRQQPSFVEALRQAGFERSTP